MKKIILHHTVQNTGSMFLWELLNLHPDVSAIDPEVCGVEDDTIWRDLEVSGTFCLVGWEGIQDIVDKHCKTPYCVIWAHNGVAQPLNSHVLSTNNCQPDYIVGCLRDPLLMLLTGLARIQNPEVSIEGWTAGRVVPWVKQFALWQQKKIQLLPVDLWGTCEVGKRQKLVREFLENLELDGVSEDLLDYINRWPKSGMFVHSGSVEMDRSPIKGWSQRILEAYYEKDLQAIEDLMGPHLQVARVIAGSCRPMFDHFGYDFWWKKSTPKGI